MCADKEDYLWEVDLVMCLSELGDDVLKEILSFVGDAQLAARLPCSCKRLHTLLRREEEREDGRPTSVE